MIKLYQYENCPYCRLVRAKFEALQIPYEAIEVSSDPSDPQRAEVIAQSGTRTVPVIHDAEAGIWMGESADIVAYLERLAARAS